MVSRYCECFAAGAYCDGCGCNCCGNNVENEDLRQDAMESILERNPNAFRPKIDSSRSGAQDVVCKWIFVPRPVESVAGFICVYIYGIFIRMRSYR